MHKWMAIDSFRKELQRLNIATRNIQQAIEDLERQERENVSTDIQVPLAANPTPTMTDSMAVAIDGRQINIGDRGQFLTKGRYRSTKVEAHHFSSNHEKVFALNSDGFEIPRAPRNVRMIDVVNSECTSDPSSSH